MIKVHRIFLIAFVGMFQSVMGQNCVNMRPLTDAEHSFQSAVVRKLQAIFEVQQFEGYIIDEGADSYAPQVWSEVCADRNGVDPFNLLGFYTYVLDPGLQANQVILQQVNSINYADEGEALDKLRNLGNQIRLECEWGINTIPFTLKNVGTPIQQEKIGDVTIFRLNNAHKEDTKSNDFRARTVIVKGDIEVTDQTVTSDEIKIFEKTIRAKPTKTAFDSRLNAFLVVTGGKQNIHHQLDVQQINQQLTLLIQP